MIGHLTSFKAFCRDLLARKKHGQPAETPTVAHEIICGMFDVMIEWQRDTNQWRAETDARVKRLEENYASVIDRLHRIENKGVDE